MKILNVTPYCISNYGAMLQAWALRQTLEGVGHEVVYLNYKKIWPGKFGLRGMLHSKSIASLRSKIAINRQMDVVREEVGGWNETRPYWSDADLLRNPPVADCYLVGSDQVFGVDKMERIATGRHALLAFGDENVLRVAYAASFGRPSWSDSEVSQSKWAVPFLRRFKAMGLREESGVDILRKWSGVDGSWTPDPTLLLSVEDYWRQFKIEKWRKSRPMVFSYMLGFCGSTARKYLYEEALSNVKRHLGGDVEFVESMSARSISYWLSNIANADCVVTNSFHGICFSILFNRPFLPLGFEGENAWRNARALDILMHCGLSDRFVIAGEEVRIPDVVGRSWDWERINRVLREFKKTGREFLSSALSKA